MLWVLIRSVSQHMFSWRNKKNTGTFRLKDAPMDKVINVLEKTLFLYFLTLSMQWINSADDKLMIFFLFVPENRIFDISCKETICMNYQVLFSRKNKKIFQNVDC